METNDSDSLHEEQIENTAEQVARRMFDSAMAELFENSLSLWTATSEYEVIECVLHHLTRYSRVKRAELIDSENERILQILTAYAEELSELEAVLRSTQGVPDESPDEPDAGEQLTTEQCMDIVDEFLKEFGRIRKYMRVVIDRQGPDLFTAPAAREKVRSMVADAMQEFLDFEAARHEYHTRRLNEMDDVIEECQRKISMLQRQ